MLFMKDIDLLIRPCDTISCLPFLLPNLIKDLRGSCCHCAEPDSYLDHSKTAHPFSLSRLAWAIQQEVDSQCIERYLKGNEPTTVAAVLKLQVLINQQTSASYPIQYFAVEQNSPDLLRLLHRAGAKFDRRARPSMLPLLAYAIISAEYDLCDTTDTVICLLALGAKPTDIPPDMWENPLKSPTREAPHVTASDPKYAWCTTEVREALCRNLNLLQRYALRKANLLTPPAPRMLQVAEAHELLPLFETPYHIIGQQLATSQVQESIISHYLFDTETPLVLLLTGPSGHGKTELAKQMGELLSLQLHRVDCAEMRHETDLFGPKPPYYGHKDGSPLNNYLAKWSEKKTVVFLDEFDKTTSEVYKSLLLIFESGFYKDRRDGKKIDCTKVIWILAANLGEDIIQKFSSNHVNDHEALAPDAIDFIQKQLLQTAIKALGAPLTGRLSACVPYLPFNALEQAVATYKFMRELRTKIRKPINIAAKQFGRHMVIDYIDDAQIATHLARQGYMSELGARSLKNAVDREIGQKLAKQFLGNGETLHDGMNSGPLENYEVRILEEKGASVQVRRAGSKEIQRKRDPYATAGLLAALTPPPSAPDSPL